MTIEWALENEPGWNRRQEYEEQMKMQAAFVASMTKKKQARGRSDLLPRVVTLLDKGDEINQMTAEALGAGPQIAEIQARIDQVKKEGTGEQNIVKVRASITEEAETMLAAAMAKSPQLEGDAKAKLAAANQAAGGQPCRALRTGGRGGAQAYFRRLRGGRKCFGTPC